MKLLKSQRQDPRLRTSNPQNCLVQVSLVSLATMSSKQSSSSVWQKSLRKVMSAGQIDHHCNWIYLIFNNIGP